MPYVTEATKVNIILPVTVDQANALSAFLDSYEKVGRRKFNQILLKP